MSHPWEALDPNNITLGDESIPDNYKICLLQDIGSESEYDGKHFGARISSIFVILVCSTAATLFPVLATRSERFKVNTYVYLFARHFGTGVIVATAFVHLMDPAYGAIGGDTCVGMTGHWADYAWTPGIMLATVFGIFLLDLFSSVYVERKYGVSADHDVNVEGLITNDPQQQPKCQEDYAERGKSADTSSIGGSTLQEKSFREQFAAFLILEFGVVFHSVMIGLNLGSTGDEFVTLYIVLIFHQSFEGLGIGARLSSIEFPQSKRWLPYACCLAYGLSTPICIAIGIGVRSTYASSSFTVNVVSGVLDAISAGILIYTGLVELLARDFIFNEHRTKDLQRLSFMVVCNLLGAGLMALLGKWA